MFDCCLWLLDEPFVALDSGGRSRLSELLNQHLDTGGLAIVATHQAFECAHPIRVLSLGDINQ